MNQGPLPERVPELMASIPNLSTADTPQNEIRHLTSPKDTSTTFCGIEWAAPEIFIGEDQPICRSCVEISLNVH